MSINPLTMTNSPPPRRFQFTLRTALLLFVLAAAGASLFVSYRQHSENQNLRQEITRLRNEVGELTIEPGAENKVHAIAVPVLEARTWKWRVYIPKGAAIWVARTIEKRRRLGLKLESFRARRAHHYCRLAA
jgi:hypothetical protein